jgi:hypothetical protein
MNSPLPRDRKQLYLNGPFRNDQILEKMYRKFRLTVLISLIISLAAHSQYPSVVQTALSQTKTNRTELTRALDYFYNTKDSLKIRSINFLVANMPLHNGYDYYWADEKGQRIPYNELDYPTFNDAVLALDSIKKKRGALHPVAYGFRDIDSVKADMLIENVELATQAYRARAGAGIPENDFLEYILPYRASNEDILRWRKVYATRYETSFDPGQSQEVQLLRVKHAISDQFRNLYGEPKSEPLPRLNALQILLRKKGYCEDMADMAVFIARSRGIAATVDNIPAWATATGNHFLNFMMLDSTGIHFDAVLDSLGREPAKVLRTTYSAQEDAIANWLDTAYIPKGFMRIRNYKDVTPEYWPVGDISVPLLPGANKKAPVVYACVYNSAEWLPVWYGRKKGDSATFTNMSRGVVYLPMSYEHGKFRAAGWPYALGYKNRSILRPDTIHTRSITLPEQEKYLKYRAGKKYRLFYWNGQWKAIGEQTAPDGCTQLVFAKVPANALLLMIPEYSQRKERPFMIFDNGERVWW